MSARKYRHGRKQRDKLARCRKTLQMRPDSKFGDYCYAANQNAKILRDELPELIWAAGVVLFWRPQRRRRNI